MGTAYTETFIRTNAPATNVIYTVPAGHRAVITSVVCVQVMAGTNVVHVMANGIYLTQFGLQALHDSAALQMRAVLYAGSQLVVHVELPGGNATVSGYLFADGGAREVPFEEVEELEGPPLLDPTAVV